MSKRVNLFWYNPRKINPYKFWRNYNKPKLNFGDELSALIVQHLSQRMVKRASHTSSGKMIALGSVMHYAEDGDYIWGTGINGNYRELKSSTKKLDIAAVRGPNTRRLLLEKGFDCPEVYGDPGLLSHLLFNNEVEKKQDFVVIPHYRDFEEVPADYKNKVLSPLQMPMPVLEKIRRSELVLSSSLHGLICAEALGVPARLIRFTQHEHLFKYEDYFLSTGRPDFKYAASVDEALEMRGERPPVFDSEPLITAFHGMLEKMDQ